MTADGEPSSDAAHAITMRVMEILETYPQKVMPEDRLGRGRKDEDFIGFLWRLRKVRYRLPITKQETPMKRDVQPADGSLRILRFGELTFDSGSRLLLR